MKNSSTRWHTAKSLHDLPFVPGCYVISLPGQVFYIGSAVNLRVRLFAHQRSGQTLGIFLRENAGRAVVKYRPSTTYGDWAMRELRLIRKLQPCLNTCGKRGLSK